MTTTMNRRHTVASVAAAALGALLPERTPAAALPEFATAAGDTYDLCLWITAAAERYPGGNVAAGESTLQTYCVEAGQVGDGWNLRVSRWSGSIDDGDVTGPPLVDLHDQTAGADPFTLLRTLLTGATA
jgi:hypothetical protein